MKCMLSDSTNKGIIIIIVENTYLFVIHYKMVRHFFKKKNISFHNHNNVSSEECKNFT